MYLVRLLYASRISSSFKDSDIAVILETAKKKNRKNDVTGLLCFNRKIFLQAIEGSRENVNRTYHRILNDPRHHDITLLEYREIAERQFDDWTMGYIPESNLTGPENLRFSGNRIFDPYEMSGESAHRLMISLQNALPKEGFQ